MNLSSFTAQRIFILAFKMLYRGADYGCTNHNKIGIKGGNLRLPNNDPEL